MTLTETPATCHCRSCCCRSCWGNTCPLTTTGVRAKAVAQGSSWSHLLQPPSHTAASDLPRMPIRAGPTWSEPLPKSPQWRGLPHLAQSPSLCPHLGGAFVSQPSPTHAYFFSSIKQPHGGCHTSAPTHKSFPLLSSPLSHPANINSYFQTHHSCHLRGDACPGAHMRINHPLSLPGTTSVAVPIMQGAV